MAVFIFRLYLLITAAFIIGLWMIPSERGRRTKYDSTHDNVDIESIVGNNTTLHSYLKCFQGLGSCDPIQSFFKEDIPEAISEACKKCTFRQKYIFKIFLDGAKNKFPKEFQKFRKKFDPRGRHFRALMQAISSARSTAETSVLKLIIGVALLVVLV